MMMIQMLSFPILFTSLVVFLLFLVKILKLAKKPTPKLPPGPPKLPLIGNLHQLIGANPQQYLTDLAKKYGPIMHLKIGQVQVYIISSPDLAKQVLVTHELCFPQRPGVLAVDIVSKERTQSGLVFAPYGDYWKQIRKICVMELLSAKRVRSVGWIREKAIWGFIETISLSRGQSVNMSKMIFSLMTRIIARTAFGDKCLAQDEFISFMEEAMKVTSSVAAADLFPSLRFLATITGMKAKLERMRKNIDRILENIINDHKERRKTRGTHEDDHDQDLVDVLLDFQESTDNKSTSITSNHIKSIILDIYGAGSETSANTLEWVMIELLRSPGAMAKAQAEVREAFKGKAKIFDRYVQKLEYLKLVIKETLRLHPPTIIVPREAVEGCEIDGYDIPRNAKVIVNAWAIGRDEKNWGNADCFMPERFQGSSIDFKGNNFEFIPFGAGRRICPAVQFANAEIELALAQLLYHFDWERPSNENLDVLEGIGISIRRKNDLYLVAKPRIPFHLSDLTDLQT